MTNQHEPLSIPPEARDLLQRALAGRPRGLFTDVDGTISPIAPAPEQARVLPEAREALDAARATFDVVAAVSGRSALDARRMVGLDGLMYLGNHGFERLDPGSLAPVTLPAAAPYEDDIDATLDAIELQLGPRLPGLRIERKGITGSIHVRACEDPAAAEEIVRRTVAVLAVQKGLRVTEGKMVVEVRPPVDVDKGVVVEDVISGRGLRGAIYLGDDRTDIDALRMMRRLREQGACAAVGVAVLQEEAPADLAEAADITLPNVSATPAFLRLVLRLASGE